MIRSEFVEKWTDFKWGNGFCKAGSPCVLNVHCSESESMPVHFLRSGTTAVVRSLKEPVIPEELPAGFQKPTHTMYLLEP